MSKKNKAQTILAANIKGFMADSIVTKGIVGGTQQCSNTHASVRPSNITI
jgi:hypothetical protein